MSDLDESTWHAFLGHLYAGIDESEEFWNKKPLLAHYTSLQNLENILKGDEIWLSNPLYMNDVEEVRFGLNTGRDSVILSEPLRKSFKSEERWHNFYSIFSDIYHEYGTKNVVDLYVMCFSEHDPNDGDGRLSMWRGYGGNGAGAAIVFDAGKITPVDDNPVALTKVRYGTADERKNLIDGEISRIAEFNAENNFADEYLYFMAKEVFNFLLLHSVSSKHSGFREEQEWRLVYLQERDASAAMKSMFGYHNGPRGIEPKLKLNMNKFNGVFGLNISLSELTHAIILGPTTSTIMSISAVERMLVTAGRAELARISHEG